mmetsp:Transcript_1027/g.3041  ORF Transcript_1027/g.3041 Transcript_1027/m.3041 type:complete len:211 (+) Transcript_1027:449-1081(+)
MLALVPGQGARLARGLVLARDEIQTRRHYVGMGALHRSHKVLHLVGLCIIVVVHEQYILALGVPRTSVPGAPKIPVGLELYAPPAKLEEVPRAQRDQLLPDPRVGAAIVDDDQLQELLRVGLVRHGLDGLFQKIWAVVMSDHHAHERECRGVEELLPSWGRTSPGSGMATDQRFQDAHAGLLREHALHLCGQCRVVKGQSLEHDAVGKEA